MAVFFCENCNSTIAIQADHTTTHCNTCGQQHIPTVQARIAEYSALNHDLAAQLDAARAVLRDIEEIVGRPGGGRDAGGESTQRDNRNERSQP